jgi:hypothetical protein
MKVNGIVFEITSTFRRLLDQFEQQFFTSFPIHACAYCGSLSTNRLTRWREYDEQVWRRGDYGLQSRLGLPLHINDSMQIAICSLCKSKPRLAPDAGPWPREVVQVPQRSRMFLSFAKLNCNLGRTQSHTGRGWHNPYSTYRTLSGNSRLKRR